MSKFGKMSSSDSSPREGLYEWSYYGLLSEIMNSIQGIYSPNFCPEELKGDWRLCMRRTESSTLITLILAVKDQHATANFVISFKSIGCIFNCNKRAVGDHKIANLPMHDLFNEQPNLMHTVIVTWSLEEPFIVPRCFPSVLMQDFGQLLDSGKFSDVEIVTEDGTRIPAHQSVLWARSSVFRAMLESDMLEAKTKCITIGDVSAETVKGMVAYLYTSQLPKFSPDSAAELLKVADMYDLLDLKNSCTENLLSHVNHENAQRMLLLGDLYQVDSLKEKALQLIVDEPSYFTDAANFEAGLKQRPDLLIEVINRFAKWKEDVYHRVSTPNFTYPSIPPRFRDVRRYKK